MNLQEPEDRDNTVRISGRRFEESPYSSRYDGPELVRGVYAGRFFAIFNGEDPIQKYWVLRRKALIFDAPEKPVEVSGPDAVAFLEKSSLGLSRPSRKGADATPSPAHRKAACSWTVSFSGSQTIVSGTCRLTAHWRLGSLPTAKDTTSPYRTRSHE